MRGWRIGLASVVLVGAFAFGAPPAKANTTQVCTGVFLLGPRPFVGMLALGQPATTFTLNFSSGSCLPQPPLSANYALTLHGWCEAAVGSGTVNGHDTNVVATEGQVVLTGEAVGVITLRPLTPEPDPCIYHASVLFGNHAVTLL